jgi:hypothetical protein
MSSCSGSLIATPLLALFNEASLAKGAETIEEVRREQEQLEAQRRLQIADQRGRPKARERRGTGPDLRA